MVEIDLLSITAGALFGAIFSAAVSSYIRYVNRPRIDMKLVITGINNVDLEDGLPLDKGGILKLKVINRGRTSTKNLTVSIRSMCRLGMVSIHIGSLHPNQIASFGVGTFEGTKLFYPGAQKKRKQNYSTPGLLLISFQTLLNSLHLKMICRELDTYILLESI